MLPPHKAIAAVIHPFFLLCSERHCHHLVHHPHSSAISILPVLPPLHLDLINQIAIREHNTILLIQPPQRRHRL